MSSKWTKNNDIVVRQNIMSPHSIYLYSPLFLLHKRMQVRVEGLNGKDNNIVMAGLIRLTFKHACLLRCNSVKRQFWEPLSVKTIFIFINDRNWSVYLIRKRLLYKCYQWIWGSKLLSFTTETFILVKCQVCSVSTDIYSFIQLKTDTTTAAIEMTLLTSVWRWQASMT